MIGIINILKPPGMTSHDVINFLRKSLKIRKIGHSGTLDPAAAGVLPVFIGKATKAIEFFEHDDKEYIAELTLGINTDTSDITGNIIKTCKVDASICDIKQILKRFVGDIEQIPPMYSAVHYKGKRLYELARKGVTVKREPRKVTIKSIKFLDYKNPKIMFKVCCSKGTYIRTLCEDIGNELGCGGHLSCLIRTRSGVFTIEESVSLEEFEQSCLNNSLDKVILSIDKVLSYMPKIQLSVKNDQFTKGKIFSNLNICKNLIGKYLRVYNKEDFIGIAIAESKKNNSYIRIVKSFI